MHLLIRIGLLQQIQIAGADVDGVLRGKVISKAKFLSSVKDGLGAPLSPVARPFRTLCFPPDPLHLACALAAATPGFCNVIFGWDIHDRVYNQSAFSSVENGFRDILAKPDLRTFRRVPWNNNLPFVLVDFVDDVKGTPDAVCPRSLLKRVLGDLAVLGYKAYAGVEFEFYNFSETPQSLEAKNYVKPEPLTPGMFGYSLLRPARHQEYFNAIIEGCNKFGVPLEGFHTETGPGVYEAALEYADALTAADRAALFKLSTKEIAMPFGIMPTFMGERRRVNCAVRRPCR